MNRITGLRYSATNTYLIEGKKGMLLFDTGWAGTFPAFCHALGEVKIPLQSIDYILISHFHPVREDQAKVLPLAESRAFLRELGIDGEILSTPGHSDDSITLALDDGTLFVGDLNPLYELEMHRGTQIGDSWEKLLALSPKKIYYGHARTEIRQDKDLYALVEKICSYIDKGYPLTKIVKKTGADPQFTEDVSRMYLTHQNVGVQGILDRIEIKNR